MNLNTIFREVLRRPHSGPKQHRRRPERARCDHDFIGLNLLTAHQHHTLRAAIINFNRRDLSVRANLEIVACAHIGAEIGETRRDSLGLVIDRHREEPDARKLARIVDIGGGRLPLLDHPVVKGGLPPADFVLAPSAYGKRTVTAVDRRIAEVHIPLRSDKGILDVIPAPTPEAGVRPSVVVRWLPAQRCQAVDRGGPAQEPSLYHRSDARLGGHWRGYKIVRLARPEFAGTHRLEYGRVVRVVIRACLQQCHRDIRILAQARRQHRARGSAADDEDISFPFFHRHPPIFRASEPTASASLASRGIDSATTSHRYAGAH